MRVNIISLALQIGSAVDALSSLPAGEKEQLPVIHISDKGNHLDIVITVSRDAPSVPTSTNLPGSKG